MNWLKRICLWPWRMLIQALEKDRVRRLDPKEREKDQEMKGW
jgi:hypothetical protein